MGPLCSFSKENEVGSLEKRSSNEFEMIGSAVMDVDVPDFDLEEVEIME